MGPALPGPVVWAVDTPLGGPVALCAGLSGGSLSMPEAVDEKALSWMIHLLTTPHTLERNNCFAHLVLTTLNSSSVFSPCHFKNL